MILILFNVGLRISYFTNLRSTNFYRTRSELTCLRHLRERLHHERGATADVGPLVSGRRVGHLRPQVGRVERRSAPVRRVGFLGSGLLALVGGCPAPRCSAGPGVDCNLGGLSRAYLLDHEQQLSTLKSDINKIQKTLDKWDKKIGRVLTEYRNDMGRQLTGPEMEARWRAWVYSMEEQELERKRASGELPEEEMSGAETTTTITWAY